MSEQDRDGRALRLAPLMAAALLGGLSTYLTDSALRGSDRAEQFAAVKEILVRLERKVDENVGRQERDLLGLAERVSLLAGQHEGLINDNRTRIAVLMEQLKAVKGNRDEN